MISINLQYRNINNMSICLNESDEDEKILTEIPIWNGNFYKYCIYMFHPFLIASKECNSITTLNSEVIIQQKKGRKNILLKAYNPLYCIYYKNILIANIIVDVAGWDTYYDIEWFLDQKYLKTLLILGKKFPVNILYCIVDYLRVSISMEKQYDEEDIFMI